jgi:hypothetical protein
MNLEENVFEISERILYNDPMNVMINDISVDSLINEMKKEGKLPFPMPDVENVENDVIIELVASSINYCYWYSNSAIRPGNANSGLMYELVQESFKDFHSGKFILDCAQNLVKKLASHRFPLLEERRRHIYELLTSGMESYIQKIVSSDKEAYEDLFVELIERFSGFASDIFLKRASLFFLQLYRKFGWFEKAMFNLPVPADYQVPKILHHYGCLYYKSELTQKIKNGILIPKHGPEECQIRAATVLVCKRLCDETGWNISDIDGWLWLRRHVTEDPFHLTITTDY